MVGLEGTANNFPVRPTPWPTRDILHGWCCRSTQRREATNGISSWFAGTFWLYIHDSSASSSQHITIFNGVGSSLTTFKAQYRLSLSTTCSIPDMNISYLFILSKLTRSLLTVWICTVLLYTRYLKYKTQYVTWSKGNQLHYQTRCVWTPSHDFNCLLEI